MATLAPSSLRRFGSIKPGGRGLRISALHPAFRSGRSIFTSRVFDPAEVARLLKDGHQSRKIGKIVQKGHRRGWPIFTLTLEERATCPRRCEAWGFCYGNNMQAAERIVAGGELEARLWGELEALQAAHPEGFLVRLHVLGDFYSSDYVALWERALATFSALAVFGFTARDPEADPIGAALLALADRAWDRFAIRFSGQTGPKGAAQLIPNADPQSIPCPAQSGATDCCATCALCWQSDRSIAFARH
jgi:hypothetical protein